MKISNSRNHKTIKYIKIKKTIKYIRIKANLINFLMFSCCYQLKKMEASRKLLAPKILNKKCNL